MPAEVGKVGLYLVNATAGHVGTPGAPILHLSLLVNTVTGTITGHARQTQAVQGPRSDIAIVINEGHVRATGLGNVKQIVALSGKAFIKLPPPAIGEYVVPFTASFAIDGDWKGKGGWSIDGEHINDVPIGHD